MAKSMLDVFIDYFKIIKRVLTGIAEYYNLIKLCILPLCSSLIKVAVK